MPKETAAPEASAPESFDLTLDEFCARLSATDRRVELIGGFHAEARKNGLTKSGETQFRAAFDLYASRPIL